MGFDILQLKKFPDLESISSNSLENGLMSLSTSNLGKFLLKIILFLDDEPLEKISEPVVVYKALGGRAENFCQKKGELGKMGGLSRNGGVAILYRGFSGDSS